MDLKHKALLGRQEEAIRSMGVDTTPQPALCPFTHLILFDPREEQELEQE